MPRKKAEPATPPRKTRPSGRRTLHEPDKKAKFLAALTEANSIGKAAAAAGIGRRTAYDWRDKDPDFAAAWDVAYEVGTDNLEDEATRRGRDGVDEPVYYQGAVCGTIRRYSDTLLLAQLKARRPDKYRERTSTELTGKNGAPLFPHVHVTFSDTDPGSD